MRVRSGLGSRGPLWIWAAVPLASLGIAAFVPPIFFAIRYRRLSGYVWSTLLLGTVVAFFATYRGGHHDVRDGVGTGLLMFAWLGGTAIASAFVLSTNSSDDSVAAARQLRKQRQRARKLIAQDPQLAVQAGIGRPDLAGAHDDGGLVDINRASAEALAALPGISVSLADRIVATRHEVGGYSSLDDLIDTLNVNPRDLDDARERLAFIPL